MPRRARVVNGVVTAAEALKRLQASSTAEERKAAEDALERAREVVRRRGRRRDRVHRHQLDARGHHAERERLVLSLYYERELNLKENGQVLDVTESRVCQIHGQAMVRLRNAMASR